MKKNSIVVYCLVSANSKTGVEMEALSGVSSALLAIYDLSKIVEPNLKISNTKLLVKSGGKKVYGQIQMEYLIKSKIF